MKEYVESKNYPRAIMELSKLRKLLILRHKESLMKYLPPKIAGYTKDVSEHAPVRDVLLLMQGGGRYISDTDKGRRLQIKIISDFHTEEIKLEKVCGAEVLSREHLQIKSRKTNLLGDGANPLLVVCLKGGAVTFLLSSEVVNADMVSLLDADVKKVAKAYNFDRRERYLAGFEK